MSDSRIRGKAYESPEDALARAGVVEVPIAEPKSRSKTNGAAKDAEPPDSGEPPPPPTAKPDEAGSRPTIRLAAGQIKRIVDEAELALIQARCGLYQRDGRIVFVAYTPAKTGKGEDTVTIQILERGEQAVLADMCGAAAFQKYNQKAGRWLAADPPLVIVQALRQHALGNLRFPILRGVITAPTIRADGSVLSKPGYDAATGLLFDPRGVDFPAIPDKPTRAQAEAAYENLCKLLMGFPFKEDHDRSVALSAILTACVRRSLPTAPMHAFSAPTPGTGKGKLVDIACVIATGYAASALGSGGREEEFEKRLAAKLLAGEPVIAIDNCTRPLGGDLICSMLTQERMSLRILGLSEAPSISTDAFVAASGNNLVVLGDLIRRTLLCCIDAKVEQPENRVFDNDPVTLALDWRAEFVADALTILRAYHVAGRPGKPKPLGSFEAWSALVRGALVWLGDVDPVASMNKLRKADPVLAAIRAVMGQWTLVIGDGEVTSAEAIKKATEKTPGTDGRDVLVNPDFRDALLAVAGKGETVASQALGKWLQGHQDRVVDGAQFVKRKERHKSAVWVLENAE